MHRQGSRGFLVLALWAAAVLSACGGGGGGGASPEASVAPAPTPSADAAPWPLPDDPLALVADAGLTPAVKEFFTYHVHAHLSVFVNGRLTQVPAGIGINITDPEVHTDEFAGGPTYGGIKRCDHPCISPLHTHDVTGVIHIEAPNETTLTLGQFFSEWGVRLDQSCVGGYCEPEASIAVYVNGEKQSGDPADIELAAHDEIAVVIGTPPPSIPDSYPFASGD